MPEAPDLIEKLVAYPVIPAPVMTVLIRLVRFEFDEFDEWSCDVRDRRSGDITRITRGGCAVTVTTVLLASWEEPPHGAGALSLVGRVVQTEGTGLLVG